MSGFSVPLALLMIFIMSTSLWAQSVTQKKYAVLTKTIAVERSFLYGTNELTDYFPYGIAYLNGYYYTIWYGDAGNIIYKHPVYSAASPINEITYSATQMIDLYVHGLNVFQNKLYIITNSQATANVTIYQVDPNTLAITKITTSSLWPSVTISPGSGVSSYSYCVTNPCYLYYDSTSSPTKFKTADYNGNVLTSVNTAFIGDELFPVYIWRTRVSTDGTNNYAYDAVFRVFRGYSPGGSTIYEWVTTPDCPTGPATEVKPDLYLGYTNDGLHWTFDVVNGVYRGYDLTCCATFNQSDTIAPNATFPVNITRSSNSTPAICYNDLLFHPNVTGWVTNVTDNCLNSNAINVTYSDSFDYSNITCIAGTYVNGLREKRLRTWILTDSCGNTKKFTQEIDTTGGTNPGSSDPSSRYLSFATYTPVQECGVPIIPNIIDCRQLLIAPANLTFVDTVLSTPLSCNASSPTIRQIQRNYTYTGCAGVQSLNPANRTQNITIRDTTPPVINYSNFTVYTNQSIPPGPYLVNFSDSCSYSNVTSSSIDYEVFNAGTTCNTTTHLVRIVNRVWTATDTCGNKATATQVISIYDFTAPIYTLPSPVTCSCTIVDNWQSVCPCGGPPTNVSDEWSMSSNPQEYSLFSTNEYGEGCNALFYTRTWAVVDRCGNFNYFYQVILFND